MKNIMVYEKFIGGRRYYINNYNSIEDLTTFHQKNIFGGKLTLYYAFKENYYAKSIHYKTSHTSNYVYQLQNELNVFTFSKSDLIKLSKLCSSWLPNMQRYFSTTDTEAVFEKVQKHKTDSMILNFNTTEEYEKFQNVFDGISYEDMSTTKDLWVFEKVLKQAKLIDGNAVRYGRSSLVKTNLPDEVIQDLIRYTDEAERKLKKETVEYLLKNATKPTSETVLFRGFALNLSDYDDYNENSIYGDKEKLQKYLKRRIGVASLNDIKIGNKIVVSRGKESSWSHNAEVSRSFADGLARGTINLLVKTVVNPDDILVDFTLLSEHDRKKFKYIHQNEVILKTGKYTSIINDIWVSKSFQKYLQESGDYLFKRAIGFL